MGKRIGPLVLGKSTRIYFLSLVAVVLTFVFLIPIQVYIITDDLAALIMVGVIVWLTVLFVFSFKTNPTVYYKVVKWVVSVVLILFLGHTVLQSIGNRYGAELVEHGVVADAILLDKDVRSGRSTPPQYRLTVQYKNERSETCTETFKVSSEAFDEVIIDQVFKVRYSRRYPALMRIELE